MFVEIFVYGTLQLVWTMVTLTATPEDALMLFFFLPMAFVLFFSPVFFTVYFIYFFATLDWYLLFHCMGRMHHPVEYPECYDARPYKSSNRWRFPHCHPRCHLPYLKERNAGRDIVAGDNLMLTENHSNSNSDESDILNPDL